MRAMAAGGAMGCCGPVHGQTWASRAARWGRGRVTFAPQNYAGCTSAPGQEREGKGRAQPVHPCPALASHSTTGTAAAGTGCAMVRPPPIGTPGQLPHGGNSAPAPALAASPWISERIGEPGVHFPPFCPRVVNNSADLFATQKGKMQAGKPLVFAR